MTYVFEAARLPFDSLTEEVAAAVLPSLDADATAVVTRLPLWDRCVFAAVLPVVRTETNTCRGATHNATVDQVEVALQIVKQLDELEAAYDHIMSLKGAKPQQASDQQASPKLQRTAEEMLMDEIFMERFGPQVDIHDTESASSDDVDIAMCFDSNGESVGIGSAALFGGHGFHPPPPAAACASAQSDVAL